MAMSSEAISVNDWLHSECWSWQPRLIGQMTSPNHTLMHSALWASSGKKTFAFLFLDALGALKSFNDARWLENYVSAVWYQVYQAWTETRRTGSASLAISTLFLVSPEKLNIKIHFYGILYIVAACCCLKKFRTETSLSVSNVYKWKWLLLGRPVYNSLSVRDITECWSQDITEFWSLKSAFKYIKCCIPAAGAGKFQFLVACIPFHNPSL